jgi:AcrR family transcriptional regulator
MQMMKTTLTADMVLDKAIALALEKNWESFSLVELAEVLGCSLTDIKHFYRSKDDIAEALFDRADNAMLAFASSNEYLQLSSKEKLVEGIMAWFLVLSDYKPLIREILAYKLEPGHFHLQAHGLTRISRTVQWFIEVSGQQKEGISRIAYEVAITSVYLASFVFFST